MTSILIVDDHIALRESLADVIEGENGLSVAGEVDCAEDAIEFLEFQQAGLVLLDVEMAGMGGLQGCREIKDRWPQQRVLMLTAHDEETAVLGCLMAGANGYLLKRSGRQELLRALRSVISGESYLDSKVTGMVLNRVRGGTAVPAQTELTAREQQTLALIAEGCTNREIAAKLSWSEKTARNYVSRVLEKLGFTRRAQAAAYASRPQS